MLVLSDALFWTEWEAEYWQNRPDPETLEQEVNEYMRSFEIKEQEVCNSLLFQGY